MAFDCLNNLTISHVKTIIQYSGRGPNHFGRYDSCINHPDMDYYRVAMGIVNQNPFYTGLCMPQQCTNQQIQKAVNFVLSELKVPLQIKQIQSDFPNYQYPLSIWFFITIFIIVALLVLFLLASCSKTFERHQVIGAFALSNSLRVLKYKPSNLNTLNGVRALSMLWVIFGHDYSFNVSFAENIGSIQQNQFYQPIFLIVISGLFSVDTFFFIGGFLASYAVLKEKVTTSLKYPLAIVNRYLRIIPAYLLAILIYYGIVMHLGSGPFWSMNAAAIEMCKPLWKPLLFVDNLVDNGSTMCMGWGWYLQNDMQMFVYCMLILFLYQKNRFSGLIMIYLSLAASFAYTMQQTYDHKYKNLTHFSDFDTQMQYQLDIYYKPWTRIPPYLYGLFLGILYTEHLAEENEGNGQPTTLLGQLKKIFNSRPNFRRLFQIIGVAFGCFICFIPRTAQGADHHWPQLAHSLYLTYGKFCFVFSLSLIILPSLLGVNSFVKTIMDTIFFNFIAKISFCTYLIHLIILILWFTTRGIDSYYAFIPNYFLFVSHSAWSLLFGFVMTVLVEFPCSKIQRNWMGALFTKVKSRQHKENESVLIEEEKESELKENLIDTVEQMTGKKPSE